MASPTFLKHGNTPRRDDSRWFVWARIVGRLYDELGGLAANAPKRTDTLRQLKQKALKIIDGS